MLPIFLCMWGVSALLAGINSGVSLLLECAVCGVRPHCVHKVSWSAQSVGQSTLYISCVWRKWEGCLCCPSSPAALFEMSVGSVRCVAAVWCTRYVFFFGILYHIVFTVLPSHKEPLHGPWTLAAWVVFCINYLSIYIVGWEYLGQNILKVLLRHFVCKVFSFCLVFADIFQHSFP